MQITTPSSPKAHHRADSTRVGLFTQASAQQFTYHWCRITEAMLRRAEMSKNQYYEASASPKHTKSQNENQAIASVGTRLQRSVKPSTQRDIREGMVDSINRATSKHEDSHTEPQNVEQVTLEP